MLDVGLRPKPRDRKLDLEDLRKNYADIIKKLQRLERLDVEYG